MLGFGHPKLHEIAKEMGLKIDLKGQEQDLLPEKRIDEINQQLQTIHLQALRDMGFEIREIKPKKKRSLLDDYVHAKTPLGMREFAPFTLELFYDPDEMGEEPEQATLAISISGRYFPTFADWRDPHGTLWPLVFNDELRGVMEIAKRHIIKVLPQFRDAEWSVKELHY